MKRAIDVKEEKLIEKLNNHVDLRDKMIADNNPNPYRDVVEERIKKLYEAPEATVLDDTVTLTPRNEDGTFVPFYEDLIDNPEDRAASRASCGTLVADSALRDKLNKHLEEEKNKKTGTHLRTFSKGELPPAPGTEVYEMVNHPKHYNQYDVEVIDMMERIFGLQATIDFCKLNAFKYRMRAGTKPTSTVEEDLDKESWYLKKMNELKEKL